MNNQSRWIRVLGRVTVLLYLLLAVGFGQSAQAAPKHPMHGTVSALVRYLPVDIEQDGDTDLLVSDLSAPGTHLGRWVLWRNEGQGTFTRQPDVPLFWATSPILTAPYLHVASVVFSLTPSNGEAAEPRMETVLPVASLPDTVLASAEHRSRNVRLCCLAGSLSRRGPPSF
jgi:hypothetical protein